jgi:hypothetical protein
MKRKCNHAVMVIKSTNINKTMTSHLILNTNKPPHMQLEIHGAGTQIWRG